MNVLNTEWWSLVLPTEWTAERDRDCTTVFSADGVGALQLSAARKPHAPATDDDLRDFAKEHFDAGAPIKTISCGDFTGFFLHFSVDDTYHRKWWLRSDDTVVFATYNSDLEDKGNEDATVDGILNTLKKN